MSRRRFIYISAVAASSLALAGTDPVPGTLGWDLWIGPGQMRPLLNTWPAASLAGTQQSKYSPQQHHVYHSFGWRGWWDFGCGALSEHPHLLPESLMKDYQFPAPIIPRVPGDDAYLDFLRACKGGPAASSNFDVAGPLTETVLLGNVALRVTNAPEAAAFLDTEYREGWAV